MFAAAGTISGTIPAGQGASPDFISYAKFLYPFALSVAAILAVAMIVIAGMEMVTFSWNPVRLQSAKEKNLGGFGRAFARGALVPDFAHHQPRPDNFAPLHAEGNRDQPNRSTRVFHYRRRFEERTPRDQR